MTRQALPDFLYHGTRDSVLSQVLAHGLLPRVMTGHDNWEHTASSHPEAVYLTAAYPLHFAVQCQLPGNPCILRLRTDRLDPSDLVADEDSYALLDVPHADLPDGLDAIHRSAFWRERLDETDPTLSLRALGNCAHLGGVPVEAIDQVLVLSTKQSAALVLGFADPVISPANFRFLGRDYVAFSAWLFSGAPTWSTRFGEALASPGHLYLGDLPGAVAAANSSAP